MWFARMHCMCTRTNQQSGDSTATRQCPDAFKWLCKVRHVQLDGSGPCLRRRRCDNHSHPSQHPSPGSQSVMIAALVSEPNDPGLALGARRVVAFVNFFTPVVEVSVRDFGTLRVCTWKTLNSAHFELQQPLLSAHVAMWEFRILRWRAP